ncbi:MAG: DUF4350 domain-containing protein [Oligoflexia bacterium]|nr:DUF4350 domain-containing protein [Oligoflexia bacterium]
MRPSVMGARLDALLRRGVAHIATFVPWQAVESDISHTLTRFLLAAAERKMTLSLILTPEVGIHYPYSGLPKDIVMKPENLAQHSQKGPVTVSLPPNCFGLPSLLSPEFNKRYSSFLSRMDSLLADFKRTHGKSLQNIQVVLSGSFWKYYRSARESTGNPFGGLAGDYSGGMALEFRQRVDYFYSQPEFSDPNPAAASRWKTRAMENVNYRWFHQQSESVFRHRSYQMVRRKAVSAGVREIELFTPEADPALSYNHFLQTVSGGLGDFHRLSALVDESAAFSTMGAGGPAAPFLRWSSLGGFRSLCDAEKQFLILKSLLVMGGLGGGIYLEEEEWFALSASFRARAEAFARAIAHGELAIRTRALYLTPHLWSGSAPLWRELFSRLGPEARLLSALDLLERDREAGLLIVDPAFILTREAVQKLSAWARSGRTVVLPRSTLYTELARAELELLVASSKRMDIDLGVRYRVHELGDGKLIVHELPGGISNSQEELAAWQTFLTALLSLAEIEGYCKVSDSRLAVIPMERKGRELGIFVMNGTRRAVSGDVVFGGKVVVSDLAVAISATSQGLAPASGPGSASPSSVPSNRFSLDVPPCGFLPLAVNGLSLASEENRERLAAAQLAQATRESVTAAAQAELPGFGQGTGAIGDLWN